MKSMAKAFNTWVTENIGRPGGGYITQEERARAKKRNRKKRKKK